MYGSFLLFPDFKSTEKKSLDRDNREGLFLITNNIGLLAIGLAFPVFLVLNQSDPFYFIFELCLACPRKRTHLLSLTVLVIRLGLSFVCALEFIRFLILMIYIDILFPTQ